MGKIQVLSPELINLIAAGEVVERPASVVKELVENSIDAQATNIKVWITDGGLSEIKIVDNGIGMEKEDAELAFTQHATSKISSAADLESIISMGFRGEALASISSVSDVVMDTKTAAGEAVRVTISSSSLSASPAAWSTQGTSITIKNLFAHVPARKKFLKSVQTEYNHIYDTLISISLSHPHIHFEFYHQGKLITRLPATNDITTRIFDIWGEQVSEQLYEIHGEIPGGKLTAFIGKPEAGRKDRKLQYLFINKRAVQEKALQRAIQDAYTGFLPKELYPTYFVYLELDPKIVDVNVHPRKLEVRIENGQQLFGALRNLISNELNKSTKQEILDRIHGQKIEESSSAAFTSKQQHIPQSSYSPPSFTAPKTFNSPSPKFQSQPRVQQGLAFTQSLLQNDSREVIAPESTMSTTSNLAQLNSAANYNLLQVFATYIIYQQDDYVVFVDQHAAAEKILYEKFRKQLNHGRGRPLLTPIIIDLHPDDYAKALSYADQLHKIGITLEDFGKNTVQITQLPELTPHLDVSKFIQELQPAGDLPEVNKENLAAARDIPEETHYLIATMACHGAIRAGQILNTAEMRQILNDLAECELPYNCPHGRPVSWKLHISELEKNFKRII